jgi:predicted transposase/invertase (TIGR01784 family)
MNAMTKFLDPKNDFLFRRLFGEERHKDLLIYFINSILHLKGKHAVQDVTYLKTIQDPEVAAKKQSIIDVLCKDKTGIQFIIEMQVARTGGFEKRAQYYASKAYISQMNKGDLYKNLKEVIFIALSDFIMFPKKKDWKSSHVTLDKKTYEQDLKGFSFTFIELPKFNKEIDHLETVEEKWVYFFKHGHASTDEELEKFIGSDVILNKALNVMTQYSMTEEEWNTYQQSLKHELDNKAAEQLRLEEAEERAKKAEEKGRAQGKAEGKAQGKAEGKAEAKLRVKLKVKSKKPKKLHFLW